ncbi:MAG: hypothetical protein OHK0024_21720 [Thalassobaculales bacterium]
MTPKNPFFDIDFSKLMSDFQMPGIEMDALVAAQRRNIEALNAANKLALEGVQAVAKRQAEIFQQTMAEADLAVKQMMATAPEARVAQNADLIKLAIEKAIANMTELSEMVAKSNKEAFEVINQRVAESLDELKAAMAKATSRKG